MNIVLNKITVNIVPQLTIELQTTNPNLLTLIYAYQLFIIIIYFRNVFEL